VKYFGQLKRLLEKGHKASHEKGGVDEINVTGLSGELADPQKPKGHAPDHEKDGADEINVTGLSGVLADKQLSDWQVLAEVEVTSDCDYVDFTGLDINRDWFYVLQTIIKNSHSSSLGYYIFVNGDTTLTNYYSQYIVGRSTTISAGRYNEPYWSSCSAGSGSFATGFISKGPNGHFVYEVIYKRDIDANLNAYFFVGNKTSPVANITSIRISAGVSGAIGAGSRFILARPRS